METLQLYWVLCSACLPLWLKLLVVIIIILISNQIFLRSNLCLLPLALAVRLWEGSDSIFSIPSHYVDSNQISVWVAQVPLTVALPLLRRHSIPSSGSLLKNIKRYWPSINTWRMLLPATSWILYCQLHPFELGGSANYLPTLKSWGYCGTLCQTVLCRFMQSAGQYDLLNTRWGMQWW